MVPSLSSCIVRAILPQFSESVYFRRGTIEVVTSLFTDGAHTVKRSRDSLLFDNTIVSIGIIFSRPRVLVFGVVHSLAHAVDRSAWPQLRVVLPWPGFDTISGTLELSCDGVHGRVKSCQVDFGAGGVMVGLGKKQWLDSGGCTEQVLAFRHSAI